MTFKDLEKRVTLETAQRQSSLFERLRNKSFWIWDQQQHKQEDIKTNGDCCFNHITGLPHKESIEKPIFDYQKLLYDSLLIPDVNNSLQHDFKHKHLWVKKATGLGVTEFFLRLMAWKNRIEGIGQISQGWWVFLKLDDYPLVNIPYLDDAAIKPQRTTKRIRNTIDLHYLSSVEIERHSKTSMVKLNKKNKKKAVELIGAGIKSRS
ncbi:MAG: hypothetical protein WA421_16910 [Nitrososphaeraceae archaeon]